MRFVDLSVYQSAERMAVESYVKYGCSPHSGAEGRDFFSRKSKKNPSVSVSNIFNKRKTLKKNLFTAQSSVFLFYQPVGAIFLTNIALCESIIYVRSCFHTEIPANKTFVCILSFSYKSEPKV